MLDDFLIRAILAGVGASVAASLLGCFVVWRRMAYFGDATAHAAILGVALSLAFGFSTLIGVSAVALLMALSIFALTNRQIAVDTILGVLAHGALATGLVAISLVPSARINLESYLFGDVLIVGKTDLAVIWFGAALVALVIWRQWSRMLTATLSPELAYAAGIDPKRQQIILTLLLAAVVAVAIKVIGALLITALLIVPAATARNLSRTPEAMAFASIGFGAASAVGGIGLSFQADTPAGPSIVVVSVVFFAAALFVRRLRGL